MILPLQSRNNVKIFSYEEIYYATKCSNEASDLGMQVFGDVFKGRFPNEGDVVVVRCLETSFGRMEMDYFFEAQHCGILPLIGYCRYGASIFLIYRYFSNMTLGNLLHGDDSTMLWHVRYRIAVAVANALAYLHECGNGKLIHGALTADCVLLNGGCEVKVAEFGLAKFCRFDHSSYVNRMCGYLAPEFGVFGELTNRSDCFSFGVLLLQLITGSNPASVKPNTADSNLLNWARPILTQAAQGSNLEMLLDPMLQMNYDPVELNRLVVCAIACTRPSSHHRPRMIAVVKFLEGGVSSSELDKGLTRRNDGGDCNEK